MATSYWDKDDGLYDPKKTFALTNWSDQDITVNWRGDQGEDNIYVLHAGEVKTYPEYLALYILREFVNREMLKDAAKAPKNPDGSPSKQQERLEMAMVNKDARKPYEDKTIQEVRAGQESPEVTAMRAKIRQELIVEGGLTTEMNNNPDGSPIEDFPNLPKKPGRPKKV